MLLIDAGTKLNGFVIVDYIHFAWEDKTNLKYPTRSLPSLKLTLAPKLQRRSTAGKQGMMNSGLAG